MLIRPKSDYRSGAHICCEYMKRPQSTVVIAGRSVKLQSVPGIGRAYFVRHYDAVHFFSVRGTPGRQRLMGGSSTSVAHRRSGFQAVSSWTASPVADSGR